MQLFSAVNQSLSAPFLQLHVSKSLIGARDLDTFVGFYPYISVLMQAASLCLTDAILADIFDWWSAALQLRDGLRYKDTHDYRQNTDSASDGYSRESGKPWDADGSMEVFSTLVEDLQDIKPVYCEVLELHPIHILVTYTTTGIATTGSIPFRIPSDVEDASLRLDALVLFHTHTTPRLLVREIAKRYQRQLAYEIFKLVGTADLLGNPIGLLDSLATGVAALFYEPASAIFRGPTDVPAGLAKGVGQLLHNSIHGPMNSVSKVTGAVSKSIVSLCYDDAHLAERSSSQTRAAMRSGHLGHGLRAGAEGLTRGVVLGLGGLVAAPARAVRRDGMAGLARGLSQGVVGAAVMPTVGAIDLAEGISTGVRNSVGHLHALVSGRAARVRLRPPRPPLHVCDATAPLSLLVLETFLNEIIYEVIRYQTVENRFNF